MAHILAPTRPLLENGGHRRMFMGTTGLSGAGERGGREFQVESVCLLRPPPSSCIPAQTPQGKEGRVFRPPERRELWGGGARCRGRADRERGRADEASPASQWLPPVCGPGAAGSDAPGPLDCGVSPGLRWTNDRKQHGVHTQAVQPSYSCDRLSKLVASLMTKSTCSVTLILRLGSTSRPSSLAFTLFHTLTA